MNINRRTIVTGLLAGAALPGMPRAFSSTEVTLGDTQIFSVSDGNLVLPADFFFGGLPADELNEILTRNNVPKDQLEPPCNITVLRQGDRTVLFDAGSGTGFMPTAGLLPEGLDAIGIAVEDVTDVIFTHAHPDHIWGVLDDFDDMVFPDAIYWIGEKEHAYWTAPDTVAQIGEARASFAVGAQRRLEAIEPQMQFFAPDEEVIPGVLAVATHGHTPGHMSFEIRNGSQTVFVGGDAIGNHHVAFARPDWHSGADQDPEMAAQTRQRLLDRLASDDTLLMGFHLPQGGLGRVRRSDTAFTFEPEA